MSKLISSLVADARGGPETRAPGGTSTRIALIVLIASVGLIGSAAAQAPPNPTPTRPAPGASPRPAATPQRPVPAPSAGQSPAAGLPATTPSAGALPASPVRQPRSYQVCYREALARRYRGAERRHFVSRCQLGYGFRLFRRRGSPPAGVAPAVPNPG